MDTNFINAFKGTLGSSQPSRRTQMANTRSEPKSTEAKTDSPNLSGVSLLLVEDEADVRELFVVMLRSYGALVNAVPSTSEALRALKTSRPDVLISDLSMPEEDGFSLIRKIRALPPELGGNIPALALTAFTRPEDRRRSLSAGYQMHIPKTVTPDELAGIIADVANRRRSEET